jgi:hypothetical protein
VTRTEALQVIQREGVARAWGGLEMIRLLVEYGRAVAELAAGVPPELVVQRWKDDFYLPEPVGTPGHNRAVFQDEKPWH